MCTITNIIMFTLVGGHTCISIMSTVVHIQGQVYDDYFILPTLVTILLCKIHDKM